MTNIDKIRKLLIDVNNELDYISLADTDNAIYQVYCECNRFIGNEIKRDFTSITRVITPFSVRQKNIDLWKCYETQERTALSW